MNKQSNAKFLVSSKVSPVSSKNFLKKVDLNSISFNLTMGLSREIDCPPSLLYSHDLEIKRSLYKFLKTLKAFKREYFKSQDPKFLKEMDHFGAKLQTSLLYNSLVEIDKKKKFYKLKKKIFNYQLFLLKKKLGLFFVFPYSKNQQLSLLDSSSRIAFQKYFALKSFSLNKTNKALLHFLKTREFFNKIVRSRIYSFISNRKKRYKKVYLYISKNKRKIRNFFLFNDLSKKNFRILKKRTYQGFKKLVWKRKKRLKWKKLKLRRFFGLRRRVFFHYSAPNHMELNYKTFNSVYLGHTDLNTINSRIPFWLNLRKLLTFLSS